MKLKHSILSQWPENNILESGVSGKLCTIVIKNISLLNEKNKLLKDFQTTAWNSKGYLGFTLDWSFLDRVYFFTKTNSVVIKSINPGDAQTFSKPQNTFEIKNSVPSFQHVSMFLLLLTVA